MFLRSINFHDVRFRHNSQNDRNKRSSLEIFIIKSENTECGKSRIFGSCVKIGSLVALRELKLHPNKLKNMFVLLGLDNSLREYEYRTTFKTFLHRKDSRLFFHETFQSVIAPKCKQNFATKGRATDVVKPEYLPWNYQCLAQPLMKEVW